MIRELISLDRVRAACGDDDLLMWGAQGLTGGARAWALGDAVVAAAPGVARRDRLTVWGGVPDAVELVRHALAEVGPSFRLLGGAGLVAEVTPKVGGLEAGPVFSWMSLPGGSFVRGGGGRSGDAAGAGGVGWLGPEEDGEVAALLREAAPGSYAVPGGAGVRRWAGLRVEGRLVAVAADAWSAPSVGLVAGVATAVSSRGRGLAERVCRWVSGELVAAHGRVALMVDDDNPSAIGVYVRIGYGRAPVMVSRVR
ncbi:GNAT family N-acetyltransferase [Nonomuraea cavernae]|uniref:GNAT family N-acetyltransferase n=1 Tax=Nonomuraea cavernae TaxID=2045107 RepID=UPI0033F9533F